MAVARIEKHNAPFLYGIFPVTAEKHPLPALHKPYDIMLMEMAWKRLYYPIKAVCLHPQFIIIYHCPYFFLHVDYLLVKSHFTSYFFLRLVKYLHFSDLPGLFPVGII